MIDFADLQAKAVGAEIDRGKASSVLHKKLNETGG